MKKNNFGILVLMLFLIFPLLLTFDTNRIILYTSRYNELSNDTFTKLKSSQTNIVWYRVSQSVWDDYYNAIWGDGTFWYTCGSYENLDMMHLTGWDLLLTKWDSNGNVIWSKAYAGDGEYTIEQGTNVWGYGGYIYTCGITNKDGDQYDFVLIKWDTDGNRLWVGTWGGPGYDAPSAVFAAGQYLYTCGHTTTGDADAVLVTWDDTTGEALGNTTFGGLHDDIYYSMAGYYLGQFTGGAVYLCGITGRGSGNSDLFLKKYVFAGPFQDRGWKWETVWAGDDDDGGQEIWLDGNSIYTSGFTKSDGNGGKDLLLVKWQEEGGTVKEVWNQTWGGALDDSAWSLWGYGNYLYTTGYTDSYADSDSDLLLVKWDNYGNQVWNSTWGPVFPPAITGNAYGTNIKGDSNYVYTCGHINSRYALIKWDANPEQLDFHLISPSEYSVLESDTIINVDLKSEFVLLESVLYHWDSDPNEPWSESTIIKLPSEDKDHILHVSATTTTPYISDSKSFTFTTDDTNPRITIQSPSTNEVWDSAPAYDLDIDEPHIAQRWYTLNDGPSHYFYSNAGVIDPSAWKALPDGEVTIKFYVTDTLGHLDSEQVVLQKDTQAEQRETEKIIRNTIITASVSGVVGLAFWLIKRKLGKNEDEGKPEKKRKKKIIKNN